MPYSSNTIAVFVSTGLICLLQLANFIYSCRIMHAYRQKHHLASSSSTSSSSSSSYRSYPFLIRLLLLLSNACALASNIACFFPLLLFIDMTEESTGEASASSSSSSINIDPWHETSLNEFDVDTRLCAFGMKFAISMYVWAKLFSYLFFFIKQRTVRPLSAPSRLEKLTLGLTLNVILFAIFLLIVIEPDSNVLDGTCQQFIPIYTIVFMACADVTISILYLYLFIQPLRETIELNREATRRGVMSASGWHTEAGGAFGSPRTLLPNDSASSTAHHISSSEAAKSTSIEVVHVLPSVSIPSSSSESSSQLYTTLECVMRKNTYACLFTVIFSLLILSSMVWSHISNEPHARKWVVVGGTLDIFIACAALRSIMHKPAAVASSSLDGPMIGVIAKKNQVVPLMMQQQQKNQTMINEHMPHEKHPHQSLQKVIPIPLDAENGLVAQPPLLFGEIIHKTGRTIQLDSTSAAASELRATEEVVTSMQADHAIDIHRREIEGGETCESYS